MGMYENTTPRRFRGPLAATLTTLAACTSEMPPPGDGASLRFTQDEAVEPACVDLVAAGIITPAAPLAERAEFALPKVRHECLALGREACAMLGGSLPGGQDTDTMPLLWSVHEERDTIELLLLGKADAALAIVPPSPRELQDGFQSSLLGVELFAFVVHPSSSLYNLRIEDARLLADGSVVDWRQVRLDAGPVTFVVPQGRGSVERAVRTLMPGRRLSGSAVWADSTAAALETVDRDPNAVAFVPVAELPTGAPARVLTIDGMTPSRDAFVDGRYPVGAPLWLTTRSQPTPAVAAFREQYERGDFARAAATVATN